MYGPQSWHAVPPVFIVLLLLSFRSEAALTEEELDPSSPYQPCQHQDPLMNPTHELFRGRDVVWQIPQNPKAILFLAHGGYKTALTFFDSGPHCKLCYGLPEDRKTTLDALRAGYAVIALQSTRETGWFAWPTDTSEDIAVAIALLRTWVEEHFLEGLPIILWGHSSGGGFVLSLATIQSLPVRAVVAMNIGGSTLRGIIGNAGANFPPTKFVYMSGSATRPALFSEAQVEETATALANKGVAVSRKECFPIPLSPYFFAERIPCLSRCTSEKIFEELLAENLLDDENCLLAQGEFEEILWRSHALPFCSGRGEVCLTPDVVQEFEAAQGSHAFTSAANGEVFAWLDSTLRSGGGEPIALMAEEKVIRATRTTAADSAMNLSY